MAGYETVTEYLREGNWLCFQAGIPLDSETIVQVKEIYEKCNAILVNEVSQYTPLSYASYLGLDDMVRGFLECARQTNTNLHNGHVGEFQEFVEYRNSYGDTALHIAARVIFTKEDVPLGNHGGVIELLLPCCSWGLLSVKNGNGETPLSYLHDWPECDEVIFEALEAVKRAKVDTRGATVIPIDDEQQVDRSVSGFNLKKMLTIFTKKQELIDYNEIWMDQSTYKLLNKEEYLNKLEHGELELSPNRNTILHIAAMLGDVECVKDMLQRHPSLIESRNLEGETPTYVAAKEGHLEIIEIIIGHLKRKQTDIVKHMTRSIDKETALLTAIRNHHAVVVFFLTKEVPKLANHINDSKESPLYVAALNEYDGILKLMLKNCKEIAFGGPNGKTALHAATFSNSIGCILPLEESNNSLLYAKDARGWTPLHIAASQGHNETLKYFIEKYPGCQEIPCRKGRNVFHIAVENERSELVEFMFNHGLLTRRLINQKDNDGNTPIHLLVASDLQMPHIVNDRMVDLSAINNKNETPLDMISSKTSRHYSIAKSEESALCKEAQQLFDMADNVVLVATLIATATFAAAFTVPGGFDGNEGSKQGMPILLRKSAFQAFIVTNTLAFSCSCAVLFGHMMIILKRYIIRVPTNKEEMDRINNRLFLMYMLVLVAMVSMVIAFMTGVFVVLTPSLGLAIPLCAMCVFIMFFSTVFATKIANMLAHIIAKILHLLLD